MSQLCDSLGKRLESAGMLLQASICYVCSENLENFAICWEKVYETDSELKQNDNPSAELQVKFNRVLCLFSKIEMNFDLFVYF